MTSFPIAGLTEAHRRERSTSPPAPSQQTRRGLPSRGLLAVVLRKPRWTRGHRAHSLARPLPAYPDVLLPPRPGLAGDRPLHRRCPTPAPPLASALPTGRTPISLPGCGSQVCFFILLGGLTVSCWLPGLRTGTWPRVTPALLPRAQSAALQADDFGFPRAGVPAGVAFDCLDLPPSILWP